MPTSKKKKASKAYDKIPDTLDNVAKAVLTTPPKKPSQWKYLKRNRKQKK